MLLLPPSFSLLGKHSQSHLTENTSLATLRNGVHYIYQKRNVVICVSDNRDDFSEQTKRLLANRAGVRCSNPNCRKPTSGANTDPNKIINIGVAAHITAAAPGGPRYDTAMTETERKSPNNGIWLCQSCSKLIDSDPAHYSKDLLYGWKSLAETTSALELECPSGIHSNKNDDSELLPKAQCNRWFGASEKHSSFSWWHSEVDKFCRVTEGSVVLVSGYLGVGVDVFAQNVVRNNLKTESKVIYFNLKESSTSIVNSMIAAESHVDVNNIRTSMLTAEEWQRLATAANSFEQSHLVLESYDLNKSSMSSYFLEAVKNGNADIVVLDDLDGLGIKSETELNAFLYQMRNAAIQSGTIVFVLMELNEMPRRVDKRPMLTDPIINKLCKFCDIIQFLYHNDVDYILSSETKITELIIAKNYSTSQSGVFYWAQLPTYSAMVQFEHKEECKDLLEKYPGILAGVKTLSDCLKNI